MRLRNKIALVTGSSRGVGRAVALGFAKEGAKLVVNYTSNETAAKEVVDEIQSLGSEAIAFKADVAQKTEAEGLVGAAVETFGKIDILVNNAGFTRPALMIKMTEDQWDQVVDIHLKGAFLCSQAAGLRMKEQNSGKIDRLNFCYYARGSLNETKSWLLKAVRRGLITTEYTEIKSIIEVLPKKLNTYINSIKKAHNKY